MQKVSELVSSSIGDTLTNIKTWKNVMYNVLENGLVGDGVTNDTAALQTLINTAIAAGRKLIFFPHAQYFVTSLTNANQVYFVGDNASFTGGYSGTINEFGVLFGNFTLPYGGHIQANDINGIPHDVLNMFNGNSMRLGSSSFPTLSDYNGNLLWSKANNPLTAATNGYQKLESGLIIQWGRTSSVSLGGSVTVTLPIAFPNAIRVVMAIVDNTGAAAGGVTNAFNLSTSSFGLTLTGSDGARVLMWLAIGN